MRILKFSEAIREAQAQCLEDPSVFLIGEGVGDPKNIFGTTMGLKEKFPDRVFDMPISENGVTGVCIGAAINGFRPILVHQRIDFSLYSADQLINNAAKWYSMFGGQKSVPLVVRMIVGRGWGQGNQHSQNLTALYAHVPGLKIVVPSNAYDAKGLFISAVEDPNPVLFIEHRWLYETTSHVPEEKYRVELGKPGLMLNEASEAMIISNGHATLEAKKAIEFLKQKNIHIDHVDLRSINPMGTIPITAHKILIVIDEWEVGGISAHLMARLYEVQDPHNQLTVRRITYPGYPSASSPALTKNYYPTARKICKFFDVEMPENKTPHDVPDLSFRGPF